jgi:uncharacterized SAM-dependent methyltransferase
MSEYLEKATQVIHSKNSDISDNDMDAIPIIHDIRRHPAETRSHILSSVVSSLTSVTSGHSTHPTSCRSIPTVVLYDDAGLELFDRITYLEEYYLTGAEIDILERYGEEVAKWIPEGATIIELGCG